MIKIYGADYCSACKKAKTLLEESGISFKYYDIMEVQNSDSFKELQKVQNTIPIVLDNETLIGGYNQLKLYLENK